MRPLLVSLALLLQALCSDNVAKADEQADADQEAKENMLAAAQVYEELFSMFYGSRFVSHPSGTDDEKRTIHNGVMCWFDTFKADPNKLADAIKEKELLGGPLEADDENKAAARFGVVCGTPATTDEWKCFCTERKVATYCGALKLKNQLVAANFQKGTCLKDAMEAIQNAGTKTYFLYSSTKKEELGEMLSGSDAVTKTRGEDPERAKFFCDVVDPALWKAMKDVRAADIYEGLSEQYTMESTVVGRQNLESKKKICSSWPNSNFAKCGCKNERSFVYCNFYAAAKFFVKTGYLTCDGAEKKFDKSKRPEVLDLHDQLPDNGSKGGGGSKEDTNKDKSSAAATSSLLVAPLAAAAAMLLRH